MIFSIKKGRHFSNKFIEKLVSFFNFKRKLIYNVKFDESAIYTDTSVDRFDVNKLFGFSIGYHHNDSYRFGWNCLNDKIHIYSYCYINGNRLISEICSIKINEHYKFIIYLNGSKCIFTVVDPYLGIKQDIIQVPYKKVFGYKLWPYFGGNKSAPQNINIELLHVKL